MLLFLKKKHKIYTTQQPVTRHATDRHRHRDRPSTVHAVTPPSSFSSSLPTNASRSSRRRLSRFATIRSRRALCFLASSSPSRRLQVAIAAATCSTAAVAAPFLSHTNSRAVVHPRRRNVPRLTPPPSQRR
ncbi:hypothetical protein Tsubulata_011687 [Turnera subulata]|uniref:Uncharacterized protein n=1 Tax=Turnera subulata TaxID=218843 RepID=A0A9Q0G578_9ROSI|nr:hypothetical protein Tsubulata_011687 [Turnera subulata]